MRNSTAIDIRLWDERRVSDETGIPLGTLRQHRHRGIGLPYVRIGRRVRYRPTDVAGYLAANTITPAPTAAAE